MFPDRLLDSRRLGRIGADACIPLASSIYLEQRERFFASMRLAGYRRGNGRYGSWLRENSEIEFANGNFVSTSIDLKNKSAGDGCRDKTIEKTILRDFRARTFSRSQGQKRKCPGSRGTSVSPPGGD